jgi:hypothetical protein
LCYCDICDVSVEIAVKIPLCLRYLVNASKFGGLSLKPTEPQCRELCVSQGEISTPPSWIP